MLKGEKIQLRLFRESDLEAVYAGLNDAGNRGAYFPVNLHPESRLRAKIQDGGFWSADEGLLLIVDAEGAVIGHIEFYKPVDYLDAYELSYLIYDVDARGKGATSEAVRLLTDFLFATKKANRIQLIIHPDNAASRRIAEKNGYLHEGAMRGAWYNDGGYHDVEVYAVLRDEHEGRKSAVGELTEK
jgi:[ribosomal protein S5]-alanine N-acetyltransferase